MIDHPTWVALQQNIAGHVTEYVTLAGALFVAFVCTWPAKIPTSIQEWWTWLRDAFQTAVPAARMNHSQQVPPPNPQPPVGPGQSTK